MNNLDIKIVGSVTDETELDEIQRIAKIVFYEQRMKCFNYPAKENNSTRKNYIKNYKKTDNCRKIVRNPLPIMRVRGLM